MFVVGANVAQDQSGSIRSQHDQCGIMSVGQKRSKPHATAA